MQPPVSNDPEAVPFEQPLTSAMRTSRPAARPAQTLVHLVEADLDSPLAGGVLFGGRYPANPLVARQRRKPRPEIPGHSIRRNRLPKIIRQLVHRTTGEFLCGHGSR